VKPLNEVMAAIGDASTSQKIERLRKEIGDTDIAGVALADVLEEYVASVADFLANIVLDLADDMGVIPSRKKADRELREALDLIRTIAVYRALEKQDDEGSGLIVTGE